jgi:hypothetical protein
LIRIALLTAGWVLEWAFEGCEDRQCPTPSAARCLGKVYRLAVAGERPLQPYGMGRFTVVPCSIRAWPCSRGPDPSPTILGDLRMR